MKIAINIKRKITAIESIEKFKNKKYSSIDIQFTNMHLLKINELIRKDVFKKNNLYVSSNTLFDIMQPVGDKHSHNSHNLSPKEIVEVLNNLTNPYCVYVAKYGRYAFVSIIIGECGEPLIVIIEVGSGTHDNPAANVNKMVTMYPKDNINSLLEKLSPKEILFKK